MRRLVLPVLSMVAAACASGGSAPSIADRERVLATGVADPRGAGTVTSHGSGTLDVPTTKAPAQVRPLLRTAYASLGIPITLDDPARTRIGNLDFHRTRTMARVPLSRFVECGSGMSGLNADTYRVYFSVVTTYAPDPSGNAVLRTAIVATAMDIATSGSDRIQCGTTGELERRIAAAVNLAP